MRRRRFTAFGAKDALKTPGAERTLLRSFRFGQAIADAANQILAFKAAYWPGFHQLQGDPHRVSAIGTVTNPPYTVICRSNQGVFMAALKAATAGLKINSGAKDLEASISYVESAHALLIGERLQKCIPKSPSLEHGTYWSRKASRMWRCNGWSIW